MWKKANHRSLLKRSEHRPSQHFGKTELPVPLNHWLKRNLETLQVSYICLTAQNSCVQVTPVVLLYLCAGDQRAQLTFLAVSSSCIAFSY